MNEKNNIEKFTTFTEYINDESKVKNIDKAQVEFEAALIGKLIEVREAKGLSQRELAEICGLKQPAIARLESMKTTPQIDTLFKILNPLGYTLSIVPTKS